MHASFIFEAIHRDRNKYVNLFSNLDVQIIAGPALYDRLTQNIPLTQFCS